MNDKQVLEKELEKKRVHLQFCRNAMSAAYDWITGGMPLDEEEHVIELLLEALDMTQDG